MGRHGTGMSADLFGPQQATVTDSVVKPTFNVADGGWLEARIESVDQFLGYASSLVKATTPLYPGQVSYAFRGQPKSEWSLTPTLLRALPPNIREEDALRMEVMALKGFRSQAHLYVNPPVLPLANDKRFLVDWLGLMRHHLAPTRLLDWTESPYVAAYFAVSEFLDDPGAIWLVQAKFLSDAGKRKGGILKEGADQICYFRNVELPQIVEPLYPQQKSDRMAAQSGLFTVSRSILVEHSQGISTTLDGPEAEGGKLLFAKLTVPAEIKRDLLRQLAFMNVTAINLFPGIDGLDRSVTQNLEPFRSAG